jgi:hypothetical protein
LQPRAAGTPPHMCSTLNVRRMEFKTVGYISNEMDKDITVFLEILGEEVVLSPGHEMELFSENKEEHFPMHIFYRSDGIQIYPHRGSPKWLVKFNGKEIVPAYPTKLSEYE